MPLLPLFFPLSCSIYHLSTRFHPPSKHHFLMPLLPLFVSCSTLSQLFFHSPLKTMLNDTFSYPYCFCFPFSCLMLSVNNLPSLNSFSPPYSRILFKTLLALLFLGLAHCPIYLLSTHFHPPSKHHAPLLPLFFLVLLNLPSLNSFSRTL
jgi:hypothetical protein